MIYVQPGLEFDAVIEGLPTGLTTVQYEIVLPSTDTVIIAQTNAGVEEFPAGTGVYHVSRLAPTSTDTYLILWDDGVNPDRYTEQLIVTPAAAPGQSQLDYRPTVANVASLVRNRTRDENGNMIGTFTMTGSTTPDADQVEELITAAMSEAYPTFGDVIPDSPGPDVDSIRTSASRIVALRAAALIELTYYSDQVGTGRSPYSLLQDSFEKGLPRVGKSISEAGIGNVPGTSDDALLVQWSVDCDDGMIPMDRRY